jgi:hypothetical protein
MTINAFFVFPFHDENEIFLEIAVDNNKIKQVYEVLISFKKAVQAHDDSNKVYFDSENIQKFITNCCFDDKYISKPKSVITQKLGNTALPVDVTIDGYSEYFLWDGRAKNVRTSPAIAINKIFEKIEKLQVRDGYFIIVSICNAINLDDLPLCIFKDSYRFSHLPDKFVHFPCISSVEELDLWLRTNHVKEFSLFNSSRFIRTKFVQQGKPVFEERDTGYYWYLDNLHKDEYEVFNSQYKHIATADLNGNLNYENKAEGRTIDL